MSPRVTPTTDSRRRDSATPTATRERTVARLRGEPFDLLVIGGGITGAGIARDAALRGLRTALVEQDDFAAGTSSRSSRLVHGGIRYLEHGWLGLVLESSRERRILLRIAPHVVRPLPFLWPVYAGARVPRWQLRAGLALYDALALFRNVHSHRMLRTEAVANLEPSLRRDRLRGGAMYYDARTRDARLTVLTALAAAEAGAAILNHARVVELMSSGGRLSGARVHDRLGDDTLRVRARVVVNAAGPWSDRVRALEGTERPAAAAVRGSKGVHINLPRHRLGNVGALTLLSPLDGRVFFVLPSGAQTIVGTTDTFTDTAPETVRADESDVQYLLASANAFFPEARLERSDVINAWAGIRPLIAQPSGGDEGTVSREHALHRSASGLLSITGGKLTTYRSMAADVVDAVVRDLGGGVRPARTDRVPLPGGDFADIEREINAATTAVRDPSIASHLVECYGTRWRGLWQLAEGHPRLKDRLVPELPYTGAELVWGARCEMARTLADLLLRRTTLAYELADQGRGVARVIAPLIAAELGWSDAQTDRELRAYDEEVTRIFGVDPRPSATRGS